MNRKECYWGHRYRIACWMSFFVWMCFPAWSMAQVVKRESMADTVNCSSSSVLSSSTEVLFPAFMPMSVQNRTERILHPLSERSSSSISSMGLLPISSLSLDLCKPLVMPYFIQPTPLFRGDYVTGGVLLPFRYGALTGSGSQTTLPGIGLIQEAALGYRQQLGDRWMLQLGLQVHKFHFPYAVGQQFGTSARLQYQVNGRLAFRVFGSYGIGPSYGFSTRSYGGSVWMGITDRFSLEMGVQRQYNLLRGGWETVPMLVPTYKFNKFDLGLDVGGLLHQLLHEVVIDNDRLRMGNPTIGPPTVFPR